MVPELHKGKNIYGAHIGRYQAGLSLVKDKVILDIASGSGYGTKLMAAEAKKVYGVDVDKNAISYAKEHYSAKNIEYILGDGESIPITNGTVDVVVSYETIEHIPDYKKFLTEVKRVLKPGGILLLSTPNDLEYIEDNHFHLHEFKYNELKKLVRSYFKFRKDYFQTLWFYSTILPTSMQEKEWDQSILTSATVALRPEQAIYFFMICSDKEIQEEIAPQGVIGEHYRLIDAQANNKKAHEKHEALMRLKEEIQVVLAERKDLKKELSDIKSSKAWKAARNLQRASRTVKTPLRKLKRG
jgi:ubiquinone/menaquinone biosynthesis C-methylase UbiE